MTLRAVALWIHRYVGLSMAVFLVMAGLTGSLLAFYRELDEALNPSLYSVGPPAPGARPLDAFEQREALQRQLPAGLRAQRVSFEARDGVASLFEVTAAPDGPSQSDDEYFVDPYTGRVLGSRHWGDLTQGVQNLIPFIYRLHFSLALGSVGTTLFGVVALSWTIDCFVGAYLTLPAARSRGRGGARVWLARWKPAWLVRASRLFAWMFTWHRASGLWVWGLLLAFAWSAVGLNLRAVYEPVMVAAFGLEQPAIARLPRHDPPPPEPGLDWRDAQRRGRALMTELASQHGFELRAERFLVYQPEIGAFRYQVESSLDVSDRHAGTVLYLDASDGHLLAFEAPTGQNAGRTLTTWIYQLHFGAVRGLGLAYRAFVSVLGLAIALLSVTGVWVWWVKRAKRLARSRRPRRARAALA
jgi:uncharacterized iron-regulated membrane protein